MESQTWDSLKEPSFLNMFEVLSFGQSKDVLKELFSRPHFFWWKGYENNTPWHDNKYSENKYKGQMIIDLNTDVETERNQVFFVFAGDRVVRKDVASAWTLAHEPNER